LLLISPSFLPSLPLLLPLLLSTVLPRTILLSGCERVK
jgi:hypothetical protein